MYTTIEADLENGVVRSNDSARLPAHAHVLITLIPPPSTRRHPDWSTIVSQLGKLALRRDTSQWQRSVREEW